MSSNPFLRPPQPPVLPFLPSLPLVRGIPVGAVTAFAGPLGLTDKTEEKPKNQILLKRSGWMLCDGSKLNVADYPELFDVLGYVYGGNGGDTFKIPDYGGYFLRGAPVSDDRVKDPDVENRHFNEGYGAPKEAGSTQEDALQKHVHEYKNIAAATGGDKGTASLATDVEPLSTTKDPFVDLKVPEEKRVKVSDSETRPKNIYVHFIIKYR